MFGLLAIFHNLCAQTDSIKCGFKHLSDSKDSYMSTDHSFILSIAWILFAFYTQISVSSFENKLEHNFVPVNRKANKCRLDIARLLRRC